MRTTLIHPEEDIPMPHFRHSAAVAAVIVLVAVLGCTRTPLYKSDHVDGPWAFTYFRGNGDTGLHLAVSEDGLNWTAVNGGRPVFNAGIGSSGLMRDPCAIVGPDGRFHMVWTTGWTGHDIGYAWSEDLIHWQEKRTIPVMAHEPETRNCWAPELFYDDVTGQYIIFWASTIPGRFPETEHPEDDNNHRIYYTTTRDFSTFSPAQVLYDRGFNVIDSTIEKVGDRYVMFLKNETKVPVTEKNIRVAWADSPLGPWSTPGPPISGRDWAEGPTALKQGDGWIVYFDRYTRRTWGAIASIDLETWTDITGHISVPEGMRHGTIVPITRQQLDVLQSLGNRTPDERLQLQGIENAG